MITTNKGRSGCLTGTREVGVTKIHTMRDLTNIEKESREIYKG